MVLKRNMLCIYIYTDMCQNMFLLTLCQVEGVIKFNIGLNNENKPFFTLIFTIFVLFYKLKNIMILD